MQYTHEHRKVNTAVQVVRGWSNVKVEWKALLSLRWAPGSSGLRGSSPTVPVVDVVDSKAPEDISSNRMSPGWETNEGRPAATASPRSSFLCIYLIKKYILRLQAKGEELLYFYLLVVRNSSFQLVQSTSAWLHFDYREPTLMKLWDYSSPWQPATKRSLSTLLIPETFQQRIWHYSWSEMVSLNYAGSIKEWGF